MNLLSKYFNLKLLVAIFVLLLAGVYCLINGFGGELFTPYKETSDSPAKNIGATDVKASPYYPKLDFYNMQSNDHLTILSHFKTLQQASGYTCGPVAAQMVVVYFNGKELHDEFTVAKMMGTNNTKGTNTKGMVKYFKEIKWQVKSSADASTPKNYEDFLSFVKKNLQEKTPIIVENVDWGGHWRVIIGYDTMGTKHKGDDVLIMADPFDTTDHCQDGYNIVPAERFFYMWFDAHLFKQGEQNRQWLVAKP